MDDVREVTLLPLLAGLHLRYPRFNAVVVEEFLRGVTAESLVLEPLEPGFAEEPTWRDTEELLLPWVAVPWANRRGIPVVGVHEPSPDPAAPADFERYLASYPAGRAAFDDLAATLRPLATVLTEALTLERVLDEVVPVLDAALEARVGAFGDGPGTDWALERADAVAERVHARNEGRSVVLVAVDRFGPVRDALVRRGLRIVRPVTPAPSEAAQERALLDLAWRGETADAGALIARLRSLPGAEARYHTANLLLAHGHVVEARDELEGALALELAEPPFLAGSLLARLGQLRDLVGERDRAVRAYRGALALEWAPHAARVAAQEGLQRPFELPREPAADPGTPQG